MGLVVKGVHRGSRAREVRVVRKRGREVDREPYPAGKRRGPPAPSSTREEGSAADEGASQLRSCETGAAGGVDVGSASGVDVGAALAAFAAFSLSFFFVATAFLAAALATAKNAFSDG